MDVEMELNPVQQEQEPIVLIELERGRTASVTEKALNVACEKLLKTLTDESVAKCFPTCAESHPELMTQIKEIVKERFSVAKPLAWNLILEEYNFIERANEWDKVVAEAVEKSKGTEPPQNLYLLAGQSEVTISSATVPQLKSMSAQLRERRLELEARNQATYSKIAKNQIQIDRSEIQMKSMLDEFRESLSVLKSADMDAIETLRDRMLQAVPEL